MAEKVYQTLKEIEQLTKANLHQEYENLKGFCEDSIHWANLCNIHLALKDMAFAESAAKRLREEAANRFEDGYLTRDEFGEISDKSTDLIFSHLSSELTNIIVKSCECSKGSVK